MRPSRIKAKLRRGEPALVTTLHLTDPSLYEMISLMGFDGIWMDMEHHGYSVETALGLMRAARVGLADILCRPAKGEFMRMGRMLEGGAQGIMYPRCDGPEEAAEVVKWAKFAPLGKRGFDGGNPDMPYCAMPMDRYVKAANDETFVVVQVEENSALEQVDAIAAVEGVDVVFLGPADFSVISGFAGKFDDPRVLDAMRRISAAVKKVGKNWGMPTFSVDHAKQLLDMGARLLAHGADIIWVKNGLAEVQKKFGELGFTFGNRLSEGASYQEKR